MNVGVGMGQKVSNDVAGGGGGGGVDSVNYQDWNAGAGAYPTLFAGNAIVKGNQYIVTVASAPDGNGDIKFPLGAILIARSAAPAQVDANWKIVQA